MMKLRGNLLRCSLKSRKLTWFVFRKQSGNDALKGWSRVWPPIGLWIGLRLVPREPMEGL